MGVVLLNLIFGCIKMVSISSAVVTSLNIGVNIGSKFAALVSLDHYMYRCVESIIATRRLGSNWPPGAYLHVLQSERVQEMLQGIE